MSSKCNTFSQNFGWRFPAKTFSGTVVDDIFNNVFLVCDDVANVTKTDVRLYFHMDDSSVKVEGRVAKSDRITVLLPEGVEAEVVPANKSLHTDSLVPTSRIILTDTAHESRQYLTVFTKRDDITEPYIERVEGGIRISYKQGGDEVSFLWSFTNSLKKL